MAPNRGHNRAKDFSDLIEAAPGEFDPEAEDVPEDDNASEDQDSVGESRDDTARDHYVDVGKSKLRKPKVTPLGPQYRGSRVSRHDMNEDDAEDDPFDKGFDQYSSDDEMDNGGFGQDSDEGAERSMDDGEIDGEEDQDETPDTDLSDEVYMSNAEAKATVRDLMARDAAGQSAVTATMMQAQREEIEKGHAIKKQRSAFDSLLGARMKLQKALIGVNTISGTMLVDLERQRQEASDTIKAAESAAFRLWSSLNDLREELMAAKTGTKRKRSMFSESSPVTALWEKAQAQEEDSMSSRQAVLQKWSIKARETTQLPNRERLNKDAPQATIMDVIQEQLSSSERLIKRAQTPRSCAPLQLANKLVEDDKIYDDADFYGLLLKELLEQKSHDSVAASNIEVNFGQMRREAKTKKNVDTKASKGRKLKYTVHEKLQNFMAPEDRTRWSERQTDELFKSLFGRQISLGEAESALIDGDSLGDEVNPADALMLFRN